MKKAYHLLTPAKIAAATHASKSAEKDDGNGLHLHVTAPGVKSWVSRYTVKSLTGGRGKDNRKYQGKVANVSLAKARELNAETQNLAAAGIDPKNPGFACATVTEKPTFAQMMWTRHDLIKSTWKHPEVQGEKLMGTMRKNCQLIWAKKVDTITVADVVAVLTPLWNVNVPTAKIVQRNMETVMSAAGAMGYASNNPADNPASWEFKLQHLFPKQKRTTKSQPSMNYAELPAFFAELAQETDISAKALMFTILTGLRGGEAMGTMESEINVGQKQLEIPWPRMKCDHSETTKMPHHVVPLSTAAQALLSSIERSAMSEGVVFANDMQSKLSRAAMRKYLQHRRPGLSVHGFRGTLKSYCDETQEFDNRHVEMCLSHVASGDSEKPYMKGGFVEKRRVIMEAWGRFVTSAMVSVAELPAPQLLLAA